MKIENSVAPTSEQARITTRYGFISVTERDDMIIINVHAIGDNAVQVLYPSPDYAGPSGVSVILDSSYPNEKPKRKNTNTRPVSYDDLFE